MALGVDPLVEKPPAPNGKRSIFEYVEDRFRGEGVPILFADDSSNEIADYLAVRREASRVLVQLIHCKAAGANPVPGNRVEDLFEVLGQAVKCRRWLDARRLIQQVKHRMTNTRQSRFIVGDVPTLETLLDDMTQLAYEVVVVQPGLSTAPKTTMADLVNAADAYQRGADRLPLRLIGSTAT
ncbi:MAG TPA: hypothetical protein VFQ53_04720 [Kofleriaceae bacterium]|nr:hypothetical protein [Kofleriaceae bacterium]